MDSGRFFVRQRLRFHVDSYVRQQCSARSSPGRRPIDSSMGVLTYEAVAVPYTMERPALWPRVETLLRSRLSAEEFEAWFAPLEARGGSDGRLVLVVPSRLYADYGLYKVPTTAGWTAKAHAL